MEPGSNLPSLADDLLFLILILFAAADILAAVIFHVYRILVDEDIVIPGGDDKGKDRSVSEQLLDDSSLIDKLRTAARFLTGITGALLVVYIIRILPYELTVPVLCLYVLCTALALILLETAVIAMTAKNPKKTADQLAGLCDFLSKLFTPLYKITGMLLPNYILMFISMALFVYFIIIRKMYNWKIGLVLSFILVLVNIGFIILAVANPVIIYMIEKTDRSIRNETGYPHFTQLHGSYKSMVKDGEVFGIESEGVYATGMKSENVVPEDPFAKYRIKPEDDMGMLADNDIDNDKE